MFGFGKSTSVKLDKDLVERLIHVADVAGYASVEEFIAHVLEKEMLHFEDAGSDDDIREKLKGLGYIS
jgi:predicted transcriptional regulator